MRVRIKIFFDALRDGAQLLLSRSTLLSASRRVVSVFSALWVHALIARHGTGSISSSQRRHHRRQLLHWAPFCSLAAAGPLYGVYDLRSLVPSTLLELYCCEALARGYASAADFEVDFGLAKLPSEILTMDTPSESSKR